MLRVPYHLPKAFFILSSSFAARRGWRFISPHTSLGETQWLSQQAVPCVEWLSGPAHLWAARLHDCGSECTIAVTVLLAARFTFVQKVCCIRPTHLDNWWCASNQIRLVASVLVWTFTLKSHFTHWEGNTHKNPRRNLQLLVLPVYSLSRHNCVHFAK